MDVFDSLNISDDVRHAIANGIFTAITNDIPEIIQENNLPTANGVGLFRWNYINRNVSQNLGDKFQISLRKRGPFQFLLFFDQNTGFTFSIMAERNFRRLQKRLPKGTHYLEALISENSGYEVVEGQMLLDFGEPSVRDQTAIMQLRDSLLSDFTGIVKNHILVVFEYSFSRVVSARAILVTPEFEIAFSEDWSHHLDKPYIIGKSSVIAELNSNDEDEPLVMLKESNVEKLPDNLVVLPETPDAANK